MVKDWQVARLGEAVLLPLWLWPSKGAVDKLVALRLVDSFGGGGRK